MCDLTTRTWLYTRALCLSACVSSFRPRKRRNSTGSVLTPNNLPRAGVRSPTSTPRRSSRISVVTSYTVVEEEVEAAFAADAATLAAVSTQPTQPLVSQQSTPASSGSKSTRSSAASSSSERRGRRSNQTLQMLSESLGKPSPSPSSASNVSEAAEAEPESEPMTAAVLQQPTRQLQFNDSNEETDSDDQHENEASQESDYVPERADELRCVVTIMLCVLIA